MGSTDTSSASASSKIWTELDDELPAFMAEMLEEAIVGELLETTRGPLAETSRRLFGRIRRRKQRPS